MFLTHTFQRSLCVLFISCIFIYFFLNISSNTIKLYQNKELRNSSSLILFEELFAFSNTTPTNLFISPREIIFDVAKVFNSTPINPYNGSNTTNISEFHFIHILGLFELTSKLGQVEAEDGKRELMSAKLAIQHVNALNILPGYKLVLLINDTRCDPGVAIDRLFHAIYSKNKILILLGSGCSNVTEALAHIVPYWNIIQISYGSISPILSDRRKFPFFFRTIIPDSSHNIVKSEFIKQFEWKAIAIFSENENHFLLPINDLITQLENNNVTHISTVTFTVDNFREQLDVLKKLYARIIIGSFSEEIAPHIFCTAYSLGMFGSEYVWILENYSKKWWLNNTSKCNRNQLLKSTEGVFFIGNYERKISNIISKDMMDNSLNKYVYDAVWAIALTLRTSNVGSSLETFNYQNSNVASELFKTMNRLHFMGLTGPVKFNGADRVGDYLVSQIQEGKLITVAFYDSIKSYLEFNCKFCEEIIWKNGKIPMAQRILRNTLLTVTISIFYITILISILGISCSMLFLYFNVKFRKVKTIKLSSPNLNNLILIGCILVYLSVIFFGFNSIDFNSFYLNNDELCLAKIYLLSAGFSLTFGAMFAKSYRVYRIFKSSGISVIKNKLLKDKQLIGLILIPPFIDSVIMGFWIATDPLKRKLYDLKLELNSEDPRIVHQLQVKLCQCNNTVGWHIALFGYKSIILLLGVFMAWKTRHIKIPALNDSQYIGICVYSVVFSMIIVIAFSFVTEYFILSYLATTFSILSSATITMILMFLPNLKSILKRVDTELSIAQSLGLKVQCNTRRFICDDPKEALFRLEIQNQVFRGKIESLDREIQRLEQQLIVESSPKNNLNISNLNIYLPEIHYLEVPRASWPMWHQHSIKTFSSDNKLTTSDKGKFFGKIKKFFGTSFTSLHSNSYYANLDNKIVINNNNNNNNKEKPQSNPEISEHLILSTTKKIKSESCIQYSC